MIFIENYLKVGYLFAIMARNPRQPALYEVLNRARFKDAQRKALERIGVVKELPKQAPQVLVPPKVEAVSPPVEPIQTVQSVLPVQMVAPQLAAKPVKPESVWAARPKPLRIYADRIELSLPWQIAALTLLAIVAIFLVFFRFGQLYSTGKSQAVTPVPAKISVEKVMPQPARIVPVSKPVIEQKPVKMVEPMGENAIVITSYDLRSHLEPVKQYFAQYGIATEIIKPTRGSRYLLVTQDRFDNIDKSGTDGYEMKKKIKSVGANYKPPAGSGFESFGTKPFQDIYAMKIK